MLPLLQDPNLINPFNKKYGSIQFLEHALSDSVSQQQATKLEMFLTSVLVDEEIQAKIRDAFHSYIFISYRKTDRAYAQELMRLIHQNPLFRDIALWYDEFLIPGENFDVSIEKAIQKSRLFAMVVTPNIIKNNNYVIQKEYPCARQHKIKILPVEFQKTNRTLLKLLYPKIAEPSSPMDQQVLSDTITGCIPSVTDQPNYDSSAHLYLIGLAYLNGIDIEIDKGRAMELFSSAAEKGLPQAAMKIADMYRLGNGVERDYGVSAVWLEKATDLWRTQMHQSGDEEIAIQYLSHLHMLIWNWIDLMEHEKGLSVCEELMQAAATWKHLTLNWQFARLEMQACIAAGSICQRENNYERSNQYFLKAEKCNTKIGEDFSVAGLADRIILYEHMADNYAGERQYEQALQYYLTALELQNRYFSEFDFVEKPYHIQRCRLCSKAGGAYLEQNNLSQAFPLLSEGLEIAKKLMEMAVPESKRYMSIIYGQLARLGLAAKNLDASDTYATLCFSFASEDWKDTQSLTAKSAIANAWAVLGDLKQAQQNNDHAEKAYSKALEIKEELLDTNDTTSLYSEIAGLYLKIFTVNKKRIDLVESAYKIWALLADMHPDVPHYKQNAEFLLPYLQTLNMSNEEFIRSLIRNLET